MRGNFPVFGCLAALLACSFSIVAPCSRAAAQPAGVQIDWEAANRFRLFAKQADFEKHADAYRASATKSVLAIEQALAEASGGIGWANDVTELCYDRFRGLIKYTCERDGTPENYLNPQNARVRLTAKLPAGFDNASCEWEIGAAPVERRTAPCSQPFYTRASTRRETPFAVTATAAGGATARGAVAIRVRDILVVGMGDSTASGEGNPTQPVTLTDQGFCFQRALSGPASNFYLPGREGAQVVPNCPHTPADITDDRAAWEKVGAQWTLNQCHLSLYSYQIRAALALAVENRHVTVTMLPMGCTGATIRNGLLDSQEARERPVKDDEPAPADVEGQVSQLKNNYLAALTDRRGRHRPVDLLMLTVGANDIGFSGLVADIIVAENPERRFAQSGKIIVTPEQARRDMRTTLRSDFRRLRSALQPLMGGSLGRVVFTTYGNPAMIEGDKPCSDTRRGFDGHPAFAVNGARLADTVKFVNEEFLPALKRYVTCNGAGTCAAPNRQRMTYVDGHSGPFTHRGICATSNDDPVFDSDCFRDGGSFKTAGQNGLDDPLTCQQRPRAFKPYAKRARWIRTANDSYFVAMTFPTRRGSMASPLNIHDALWGIESVVYGGAVHPTAEGHAAMADAALPEARRILGLPAPAPASAPSN